MKEIFSSQQAYFKWRIERIKRIEKRVPELFNVKGKIVLDVGCGARPPLSYYLSEKKQAKVYAGEINSQIGKSAKKIAKKVNISLFAAEKLPFNNNEFDVVYLWDILEHVKNPLLAISEAKRVAKKDGLIFIEFSPYYAYPTGHHLYSIGFPKGFLPFQFLPLSLTKRIIFSSKFIINKKDTTEFLLKQFMFLNKLSVGKFKKIIESKKLKLLKEFYFVSLPNREIKINFISRIPLLRELLTMAYSSVLKK